MLIAALLVLVVLPFTASAACGGKDADLQSFAGKYLADHNLLAAPAIASRLQRLSSTQRLNLKRSLDVSGPIRLDACHLVVSGNAPHMGTEQDAMLDVDLASGDVIAAIHAGGRIDIYFLGDVAADAARWDALPMAMREWAVKADMGFPSQPPRSLTQPRSVHFHVPPSATSKVTERATPAPVQVQMDIKPDSAQLAAIQRVTAGDLKNPLHPDEPLYSSGLADLNDDGRPDLLIQYTYASGFCGSLGCTTMIVLATPHGYADKAIELPLVHVVGVLPTTHHGMHDLQFGRNSPVWRWTGTKYDIAKTDLFQSNAQPWNTAHAPGSPLMAYATPINSVIKRLLVACEQGRPLLMLVTKQPLPDGPKTLTLVFNGWTVNLPLQRNVTNQNLWMAELSRSQVPQWLAHRGVDANSRKIAPLVTKSYLRINGEGQGEISLEHSTQATQAALGACYRY
ncbi:MAG: hypothetical protein ACREP2_05605 [Rhodanobacteraceae bacterium]